MSVKWYGEKFMRDLENETGKRLARSGNLVSREAKKLLSTSGTGVRKGGAIVRAVKATGKRIYGAFPSLPGEPPHKQTGKLRASVTYEVLKSGGWFARIGTNLPYGKYLQFGTKRIKPRPWLDVALKNTTGEVRRAMSAIWNWHP